MRGRWVAAAVHARCHRDESSPAVTRMMQMYDHDNNNDDESHFVGSPMFFVNARLATSVNAFLPT